MARATFASLTPRLPSHQWTQWSKGILFFIALHLLLSPGGVQATSGAEWKSFAENMPEMAAGAFGWKVLAAIYGVYLGVSFVAEYFFAKIFCDGTVKRVLMVTIIVLIIGRLQRTVGDFFFPYSVQADGPAGPPSVPMWFRILNVGIAINVDIGIRKYFYGSGSWRNLFIGLFNRLFSFITTLLILLLVVFPSFLDDIEKERVANMKESARRLEAEERAAQEELLLRAQIDTAYKSLTEKRKMLNAKDVKAVEAFNAEAARYQELQQRLRERQGAAGSPPASTPVTPPPAATTPAPAAK